MAGINAQTGEILDGFAHVEQSLETILTTPQGARVMREWFGNPGLKLLGENLTLQTVLLWVNICYALVELFEPRIEIVRFAPTDPDRLGGLDFTIYGKHRPYAHLDWEQAAFFVSVQDGVVRLNSAA